jgi:hypothetical protein
MNPLFLAGIAALGGIALISGNASGSTSSSSAIKPPSKPPAPPSGGGGGGATTPTSYDSLPKTGGRAFVQALPALATAERDELIFEAVRRGFVRTIRWVEVSLGKPNCSMWVMSDCLAVGTDEDFVRVNVRNGTAQRIADLYGASLNTTRTSDLAYLQAAVRLLPHNQTPDSHMADTSRMLEHHDVIEADLMTKGASAMALVRTVGKEYVLGKKLDNHAAPATVLNQYGWHSPQGTYPVLNGLRVMQPEATSHGVDHDDYSMRATFIGGTSLIYGEPMPVSTVLQSEKYASLLSDEGPLKYTRHPSVPVPGGVLV